MCTVTPISMTVGANRIVPTIAIPHPLGNPALTLEEEECIAIARAEIAEGKGRPFKEVLNELW